MVWCVLLASLSSLLCFWAEAYRPEDSHNVSISIVLSKSGLYTFISIGEIPEADLTQPTLTVYEFEVSLLFECIIYLIELTLCVTISSVSVITIAKLFILLIDFLLNIVLLWIF